MIGDTVRAYCAGRDDARYGRGRGASLTWTGALPAPRLPLLYCAGFRDETRRMVEAGRLAQLELPLFERSERRRAPRRRARERDSSGSILTELDIPPAR